MADFTCAICHEFIYPFRQPVVLNKCDHPFCTECLDEISKAASRQCPLCRQTSKVKPLSDRVGLYRVYLSTVVPCVRECDWAGEAAAFDAHCNECPSMRCPGCQQAVKPPDDLDAHMTQCDKISVPCDLPNCTATVPPSELDAHRQNCPARLVGCPFPGCPHVSRADELEQHTGSNLAQHLMLAMTEISRLRKRVEIVERGRPHWEPAHGTCPQGHLLQMKANFHRPFTCDSCDKKVRTIRIHAVCDDCDYDLCTTCLPPFPMQPDKMVSDGEDSDSEGSSSSDEDLDGDEEYSGDEEDEEDEEEEDEDLVEGEDEDDPMNE